MNCLRCSLLTLLLLLCVRSLLCSRSLLCRGSLRACERRLRHVCSGRVALLGATCARTGHLRCAMVCAAPVRATQASLHRSRTLSTLSIVLFALHINTGYAIQKTSKKGERGAREKRAKRAWLSQGCQAGWRLPLPGRPASRSAPSCPPKQQQQQARRLQQEQRRAWKRKQEKGPVRQQAWLR